MAEEVPRGTRVDVIVRWWASLSELDRERARYFAGTDGNLSRGLFMGLSNAGVLAVGGLYRGRVADGLTPTMPMPPDVRAWIQGLNATSSDS